MMERFRDRLMVMSGRIFSGSETPSSLEGKTKLTKAIWAMNSKEISELLDSIEKSGELES